MGSRDRDTKSLQEKFKVFFKKAGVPARSELCVTAEMERELGADTPLPRRLRAARDLADRALQLRIQDGGVERVWAAVRDMLDGGVEARHATLGLLRALAEGQADRLAVMRTVLFHYLRESHERRDLEDDLLRFRLLHALTNTGKNITCFEEQIGAFLVEWMTQIQNPALQVEFLQLVTNVVKFNASSLDEDIVHGIVNGACCVLCAGGGEAGAGAASLALLEAVVSYSLLPRAALRAFVAALCRAVNLEPFTQPSWKLMRCVVGAHTGHAALQELVELARGAGGGDAGAVRGAVFYVSMALWGPRRVPALHVSFLAVLPAFRAAAELKQPVVTYEVLQALQVLVSRAPHELHEPAWDAVLQILRVILEQDESMEPRNELIHGRLHALITSIEQLHTSGQWGGDPDALLELVDAAGHARPDASAMWVVTSRANALSPWSADWTAAALQLADKYVRHEPRRNVRLHALSALVAFIMRHRLVYGEELVERVGAPVAGVCATDAEPAVRAAAARAAGELARATAADVTTDLIDLLDKILNRPFEVYVTDVAIPPDADVSDLTAAVRALRDVLRERLRAPPAAHAARAALVLLDHLQHHYRRPALLLHHPDVRLQIFDMIFGLRANAFNCVGLCYDETGAVVWGAGAAGARRPPVCSPFLVVEPPAARGLAPAPAPPRAEPAQGGPVLLPCARAARALTAALTREMDWAVLSHVLRALPVLLQTRALAVGRRAQDLDLLASTLCAMVSDRSLYFPECLRVPAGHKLTLTEFQSVALPPLAALAPYHAFLEPHTQQRIVRCLLKFGMVLRTPAPYINALTIFTLETRDTMVKMLPEVLLDLSKISDTKLIASPMLEFLSTLTRLPRVFASFVEDQYMSVFAILLPYTNPSRYNHYVVSLAHHVIAAWFLKCRLSYRRNFVRFIIHGLHNYIILPFTEQGARPQPPANEDSSHRQRSSSLGSRAVSRAPLGSRAPSAGTASAAFHVELTETCVDLLSRYAFTPCSVKPHRSDTAEFIFEGGQSMTWLVGHKLVTITTSGCLQNSIKQGLCERCATLCRQHAERAASPLPATANTTATATPTVQVQVSSETAPPAGPPPTEVKRYSKHSLQHSRSTDTSCSSLSADPPVSRQNSGEGKTGERDPVADALTHFTQRFERVSREVDGEESGWSRVGELAGGGQCPCWCARWAEVRVRAPAGDTAWVARLQNAALAPAAADHPLQDVAALLAHVPPPSDTTSVDAEVRSRSGSGSSQRVPSSELHKSSSELHKSHSDSVVVGPGAAPPPAPAPRRRSHSPDPRARMTTQPINIPGSPQRQSSSSTTDDDDILLIAPSGKSRHPVRRSNSSPEMSSWKLSAREEEMIVLPGVEPPPPPQPKKPAKKSDMRVSCEAIPEEMSGTSPLNAASPRTAAVALGPALPAVALGPAQPAVALGPALPATAPAPANTAHTLAPVPPQSHSPHPHLMTYNSDPGTRPEAESAPASHHHLQKTASDTTVTRGSGGSELKEGVETARLRDDLPPLARSKRSNTISVMSPTRRHREGANIRGPSSAASVSSGGGGGSGSSSGGGLTPAFVFLQLYHNMSTYPITPPVPGEAPTMLHPLAERPLRVSGPQHERTIKNLDLVPPLETYKVGVLYVGPGQAEDEVAILRNEYGSVRYAEFLTQLGTLVSLEAADDPPDLFLNLEKGGKDGRYTYVWTDDVMQLQFHVATAMPCSPKDPTCNEKRKYIGNDYVSIVYNDSGQDFNIHTIKGQLNFCIVVVEPFEHGMNRVFIKTKDERIKTKFLAHLDTHCVSDPNVALLARQIALHCSLASHISQSLKLGGAPYASNALERLRLIKRLRQRAEAERLAAAARAPEPYAGTPDLHQRVAIDDFNDYT